MASFQNLCVALLLLLVPCVQAISYDNYDDPELLIIFLCFGVGLGALVTHILSRFGDGFLPYTVVIFLLGILIAVIVDNVDMGDFGASVTAWSRLDPEMMLFLFLPVLLFGEAMSLKWHHVKGGFPQALMLAGPGVGIGAILMASFVKYALPYSWGWNLAMIFGSIVSATDPVAVVALLKSAGASPKLTILIIGESLMNDGTAMVLFTLFYEMLKGKDYSGGDIVAYFLKMALGAPLLGAAIGLVCIFWMGYANRVLSSDDVTVQIAITILCAYTVFFTAEYECGVSGVLACCSAGVMFAWQAPPLILEHETMHHVWGIFEWLGNTLLFLLAGLIIGGETLKRIDAYDWGYLILLYIVLLIVRCIIITLLYPIISNIGLKCKPQDAAFMAWAGLRGALSMALALIVQSTQASNHISQGDSDKIFFFVGGIAALTLLINATTANKVLSYLGLLSDKTSLDKVAVMFQIRKRLSRKTMKEVDILKKELNIADSQEVIKYNSLLLEEENEKEEMTRMPSLARDIIRNTSYSRRNSQAAVVMDLLCYVKTIFLNIVRVVYWHNIEDGKLLREGYATQCLLYSVDNALDRVHKKKLRDWKWLCSEMKMSHSTEAILNIVGDITPGCVPGNIRDIMNSHYEEQNVYILTNFIEAHEKAQKKIFRFMGLAAEDDMFQTAEQKVVIAESKAVVEEARQMLAQMNQTIVTKINARQAARVVLNRQAGFLREMIQEGLLKPNDAEEFFAMIRDDNARINREKYRDFR